MDKELLKKLSDMKDGERLKFGEYLVKYDEDSWFGNQYRLYKNSEFVDNSIKAETILKIITISS